MQNKINWDPGSFRDPASKVYELATSDNSKKRILRGLSNDSLNHYRKLSKQQFFSIFFEKRQVIDTKEISLNDVDLTLANEWAGFVEHEQIPFISYPYEWTFSMLKDAALLQLDLLEVSLENGWTLKDATPYNIQWQGTHPIFIDTPSFEPWVDGEPWVGYRQFCSMFLTPLLLKTHLDIDYIHLLKSSLDGIPPTEAVKFFHGLRLLKRGVLSHIYFPAKVENAILKNERDDAKAKNRHSQKHSKAMIIGLIQSLKILVNKLEFNIGHTDWSKYDTTHSYEDYDLNLKKAFVEKHASSNLRNHIWDIGCNTGTFSRICSKHCNQVISVDGDFAAIERLYLAEKKNSDSNILPLVIDMANFSPPQGFASKERKGFDMRGNPDLIVCLALIHHMRISSNIPNLVFIRYLRSLESEVIIEFVDRHDEMVEKLLTNKKEPYIDYNRDQFISEIEECFIIQDRQLLKNGKRELFFLTPA